MENFDTATWTAGASVQAFGVTFGVRVDDAAMLPELIDRLPPGSSVSEGAGAHELLYSVIAGDPVGADPAARHWHVYAGEQSQAETSSRVDALEAFEGAVRFDVAQRADQWTFVHAGVVEWRGRAIVMPGASYSGKSRLVEALVRAGATYYSDEFAVLDAHGLVHPFAKALTLRRETGGVDRVSASDIGGAAGQGAIPVGLVVATQFVSGTESTLSEMSPAAALVALLTNTVRAQVAPAEVMKTLAGAVRATAAVEGPRGEAAEVADDLLRRASFWSPTTGETA